MATPAHAQSVGLPPHNIADVSGGGTCGTPSAPTPTAAGCYVSADPGLAFNVIGNPHTVVFTCGAAVGGLSGGAANAAAGVIPGCYNVSATVTDEYGGDGAFTYARCGNNATALNGSTVNCASYASPLCPVGYETSLNGPLCGTRVLPTSATYPRGSQLAVSINSGAPHSYLITFTGYTPLLPGAGAACPAGFTYVPGPFNLSTQTFAPPFEGQIAAPDGACAFTVTAEKKYVEITKLTLTQSPACGGALVFSEGLKAFFGPSCRVTATATGVVVLKSVGDCALEAGVVGPNNNARADTGVGSADFPAGSYYTCVNGVLEVIVPIGLAGQSAPRIVPNSQVPVTFTAGGQAGVVGRTALGFPSATLGTGGRVLCSAGNGGSVVTTTGDAVNVCPIGPGTGTVSACVSGAQPDTQGPVCATTAAFTFTLPNQQRVVPYIRWSGEKQVLTKCFGGAGQFSGALVGFTLEGAGASANATLLPIGTSGNQAPGGADSFFSTQNTVVTLADQNGCASVIVYASGEGVVNVDAAIYSTTPNATSNTPLINEHAFEVFYLKLERVDLENIKRNSTSSGTLTGPVNSLAFTATPAGFAFTPAQSPFSLPSAPGANPQPAGGYPIGLCATDYVRAMVHGYFEWPGDPSARPQTTVGFTGAPNGNINSVAPGYVLPAGRWVLPDDWPVLATFAGFTSGGSPNEVPSPTSSVFAWDLNSGWVFNPGKERAVLCAGPAAGSPVQSGALTAVSTGPCFSQDVGGVPYSTAPQGPNCGGGLTVGIGPFDITQACTNPYPLTYSPAGSSILASAGPANFNVTPLGPNSTYLPNATLNEWDAPMPAAQVSFGISAGPGTLHQVNKTALYQIPTVNPATGLANGGAIYPDPFYSEAIPASPAIPPVTNNGGYLWNTFGLTGGTATGRSALNAPGFVAGESPNGPTPPADVCPPGTVNTAPPNSPFICTFVTAPYGPIPADETATEAQCTAAGGTFTQSTPPGFLFPGSPALGTCTFRARPAGQGPGINVTNFGPGCPATLGAFNPFPSSASSVTVFNAGDFRTGMTVEIYSSFSGQTIATGLKVTDVTGNTITFDPATVPAGLCVPAGYGVFVSEQAGLPIPVADRGTLTGGDTITIVTPSNVSATATIAFIGPGAAGSGQDIVYVNGAEALARALGDCVLSRGPIGGPVAFGTCEPADFLPAGTIFDTITGPLPIVTTPGSFTSGQGPYPFWQWLPNPAGAAGGSSATVYSDNHGESVVEFDTGILSTVPAVLVGGVATCPTNYTVTPNGVSCLLNLLSLGAAGSPFANILGAVTHGTGCVATSGNSFTAAPATNPAVGATGPADGQICVNNLGGIEFGKGATLGATQIQAIADYPYDRLHPAIASGTVSKVFTSLFAKTVTLNPNPPAAGNPGPGGTVNYTVTITGNDLCGNPITDEPVNVYALTGAPGAVILAPLGGGTSNGTTAATVYLGGAASATPGVATLSLEVLSQALGTQGLVLKVVFPLERIERFVVVQAGQTAPQTATVIYPPGYNMVGGPANSNFGNAEALFSYDATAGTYGQVASNNVSSAAPTCAGYFAFFASAQSVTLNVTSKAGDTAVCSLKAGWNLVGNPFASQATLQSGTLGYYYNPSTQAYETRSAIPVGGAIFIYEAAATTVTLTAT